MYPIEYFQGNSNDLSLFDKTQQQQQHRPGAVSPTANLARDIGTDAHKLQLMKASLFSDGPMNVDFGKSDTIYHKI